MDGVKNPDAWKAIAYWLSIEQLVALILTGNRWMIAVLSRAPYLQADGKYYPIADLLSGLTQWTIPDPYPVRPDNTGVISFPPQLRSLSVSLLGRPSLDIHAVNLPASLTILELNSDLTYRFNADAWVAWSTAIRTSTSLKSIFITHESEDMVTKQFAMLGVLHPNLTSLTIGTLNNTSIVTFQQLLPASLTKLSISQLANEADLHTKVPTLTNLSSLTLSSKCFRKDNHYLMRNLPAQLQELIVVDDTYRGLTNDHYYAPVALLSELPRTITAVDVWISLTDNDTLAALERLPLKSLKLRSGPLQHGQQQGNFAGSFPALTVLELWSFLTVVVPPSVTSLEVIGSPKGSVDVPSNIILQHLIIQDTTLLADDSRTTSTFRNLTSCAMDVRYNEVPISVFLTWLNPLILQSLNLTVYLPNATTILGWLSAETKVLTGLTLVTFTERQPLTNPTSEQLFDLPESLTSVSLIFSRSYKLKLARIPAKVINLQLDGIIIDTTQLSGLTELKQLTIDPEAIMGVVNFKTNTREQLERQMTRFLTGLPAQLSKMVITKFQFNFSPPYGMLPSMVRYDPYHWFNTGCRERDIRATIAEIMVTLIPSYQQLPFRR